MCLACVVSISSRWLTQTSQNIAQLDGDFRLGYGQPEIEGKAMKYLWTLALLFPSAAFAESPIVRDNTGALVGFYVGPARPQDLGLPAIVSIRVVTTRGYSYIADTSTGALSAALAPYGNIAGRELVGPFWSGANCTGAAFAADTSSTAAVFAGGFIIRALRSPSQAWYAPKGSTSASVLTLSEGVPGNCLDYGGVTDSKFALPLLPNDANVTGYPDSGFVPPLRLDVELIVVPLLKDGYESPA